MKRVTGMRQQVTYLTLARDLFLREPHVKGLQNV